MDIEHAIRGRRTIKAFAPEPVDRETLDALFELARWAPNHHLTEPWEFRVVGPRALDALRAAAGPDQAGKLARAPTLVVASVVVADDPVVAEEDRDAAAVATYLLLLGAHARGLAGYWRTPAVLRTPQGRAAVSVPDGEAVLGLVHLGHPKQDAVPPGRSEPSAFATYLG